MPDNQPLKSALDWCITSIMWAMECRVGCADSDTPEYEEQLDEAKEILMGIVERVHGNRHIDAAMPMTDLYEGVINWCHEYLMNTERANGV